jgi:PAS domain S-box-containing protein
MIDRYSETELTDLYDFFLNAPIALHVLDRDGVIRMANEAALRMTGHCDDPGEHVGRQVAQLHTDPAVVEEMLDHRSHARSLFSARMRLRHRDGSDVPVVMHASARVRDGEPVSTRCVSFPDTGGDVVSRDVGRAARDAGGELAAMEEAERQELFDTLGDFFENAPVALHIVGPDGLIRRANRLELGNLGYADRPEEYIGHHIAEFHADPAVIDEMLERLVGGRPLVHYRARLIRRGGETMPVVIYSSPRFDGDAFVNTRCFTFPSTVDAPCATPSYSWPRNDADAGLDSNGNPLTVALRRLAGRKAAEESLGFSAEVGKALVSGDYVEGVGAVCGLIVPFVADWCSVEIGSGDGARSLGTTRGSIAGSDELIRTFANGERRNEAGYHVLRVPLATVDGAAGTLLLVRDGGREDFGAADRALAEDVARRITLAVELGRLRESLAVPPRTPGSPGELLPAGRS